MAYDPDFQPRRHLFAARAEPRPLRTGRPWRQLSADSRLAAIERALAGSANDDTPFGIAL